MSVTEQDIVWWSSLSEALREYLAEQFGYINDNTDSTLTKEIITTIKNSSELILKHSDIDMSFLKYLGNLKKLVVKSRGISNVDTLQYCTQLEDLYISNKRFSDITPLATLTNLKKLVISNNNIKDISPL